MALAKLARALEGRNLEADDAALHRNHVRRGAHGGADYGCGKMADVDDTANVSESPPTMGVATDAVLSAAAR